MASPSSVKLYLDLMSQPCRALQIFVRRNKKVIPCQEIPIALRKREHLTEGYAKINTLLKVPAIDHNGYFLSEGVAIMRYLCREFPIPEHWYPKDSKKQGKVDEILEWQHLNIRLFGGTLFQGKVIQPMSAGVPPFDQKRIDGLMKPFNTALDQIENIWLKENLFIAGNEVSIADLSASTELEQPIAANCDICEGRPKLKAYLERIKLALSPEYEEAHFYLYRVGDMYRKGGLDALRGQKHRKD